MKLFPFIKLRPLRKDNAGKLFSNKIEGLDRVEMTKIAVDTDRENSKSEERGFNQNSRDEAKDHVESLVVLAEFANEKLRKKNIPVRFTITEKDDEVYINLARLNSYNEIVGMIKKEITHDEFSELVKEIEEGEGLLFNQSI